MQIVSSSAETISDDILCLELLENQFSISEPIAAAFLLLYNYGGHNKNKSAAIVRD